MALANFFDRAAQSAAQVLSGFEPALFTDRLNSQLIGIAFDGKAMGSSEGRATLDLIVRLLARLYPRLALSCIGSSGEQFITELRSVAYAINPDIELSERFNDADVLVVVGTSPVNVPKAQLIYVGSEGWIARVSSNVPVESGRTKNPFGAGAAACLGAANVFRLLFSDQLAVPRIDADLQLSLLDYSTGRSATKKPALGTVDIGEAHLIGLGAIGNGAVWALARVPSLKGILHLIDPETVDLSNLQRYVLMGQAEINVEKVAVAARYLKRKGLDVRPHIGSWTDYLQVAETRPKLDSLAVALDTERDRIAVQASLPKWVANSWTQPGDIGVSRHTFLGPFACMACLYMPKEKVLDEDEVIASALAVPEQKLRVRELLVRGLPVGPEFILEVATRLQLPPEALLSFADQPLRVFYQRAFCGGMVFKLSRGEQDVPTTVPLAFQSAMAGIMLAAELVIEAGELRPKQIPTKTVIDLLRPVGSYLSIPVTKPGADARARCICQDPDYVSAYKAKHCI